MVITAQLIVPPLAKKSKNNLAKNICESTFHQLEIEYKATELGYELHGGLDIILEATRLTIRRLQDRVQQTYQVQLIIQPQQKDGEDMPPLLQAREKIQIGKTGRCWATQPCTKDK